MAAVSRRSGAVESPASLRAQSHKLPRASVIVLNHNGRRYLDACLAAVLRQKLAGEFEVMMADNASSDGSVGYVEEHFPGVGVLALPKNLGFSAAYNRAFDAARGDYLILLNNDTEVRAGWLAALVEAADSDQQIGAVTSKMIFRDRPDTIQNAGSLLLSDGSGADRGFGEPDCGQYEQREEVFAACGGAMLLTRRALLDVGGLDETFFAYYEDTDLSWRIRLRGWRIIYEPSAVVEHVHAGTNAEWSAFFTFHAFRNRLFMLLKDAPSPFVVRAFGRFAWLAAKSIGRTFLRMRRKQAEARGLPGQRQSGAQMLIYLRIGSSLLVHFPEMLVKRWRIRHRRRVSDSQIVGWFYPRELWDNR